jgi:hypothetical protein
MAIRKNKKFIDPRYFMDEKTDGIKEELSKVMNESMPGMEPWGPDDEKKVRQANKAHDDKHQTKQHRAQKEAEAEEVRQALGNDWQVNVRMLEDRYQLTVNKQSWAGADYTPEEVEEADVQDIASKFGVDASVEITDDGSPVIVVHLPDGETATYNDSDEMYDALSKEEY